jgi:hypothetical protein
MHSTLGVVVVATVEAVVVVTNFPQRIPVHSGVQVHIGRLLLSSSHKPLFKQYP